MFQIFGTLATKLKTEELRVNQAALERLIEVGFRAHQWKTSVAIRVPLTILRFWQEKPSVSPNQDQAVGSKPLLDNSVIGGLPFFWF